MDPKIAQMLSSVGPLVVVVIVFYFFMIRPQKKKENEIKSMRANLKVGDDIITIGGIIGKVVLVKEDYVVIESSGNKSRIDVMKWGINSVIANKNDLKA
ncbi:MULTISPECIES: preprotein translocase subunit YajC [Peptoniphilus]|uniref:preprotein translocase subunit YajC n=1 Tax=Peptoniphilus TaxID=162289 RepID=UPI0001DA9C82|nr:MULTISPECIES: preprotein translocase subunit YajC [Peptoniphilus]EFI42244.1 preprotein translocase, YajC subunit [Peptoniphilus sp. oral taxon 386 str. F0131]